MVPSSARITSGEPALAQASAQSRLTGFFRFLVNAQAESRMYPFTVAALPCAAAEAADAKRSPANIARTSFFSILICSLTLPRRTVLALLACRQQSSPVSLPPLQPFSNVGRFKLNGFACWKETELRWWARFERETCVRCLVPQSPSPARAYISSVSQDHSHIE